MCAAPLWSTQDYSRQRLSGPPIHLDENAKVVDTGDGWTTHLRGSSLTAANCIPELDTLAHLRRASGNELRGRGGLHLA
jgi:hypothetical protein